MKTLRFAYAMLWIVTSLAASVYFAGLIQPCGSLAGNAVTVYTLETCLILFTLFIIYFTVRIFNFAKVKKAIAEERDREVAHRKFILWSAVRISLLFVTSLLGLLTFWLTLSESGAYCTLITMIGALFCFPRESTFKETRERKYGNSLEKI